MGTQADPFDLQRFVDAQKPVYDRALKEIQLGVKASHWMWFVFPQIEGLGLSETSRRFAIKSLEEAKAYLEHPLLGARMIECTEAALAVEGRSALEIFGSPDCMKLQSSATLFVMAAPGDSPCSRLLEKYFDGIADVTTLRLLAESENS